MSLLERTATKIVRWSATLLGSLLGCGIAYELERIREVEPSHRSSPMVLGIAVHDALAEWGYTQIQQREFSLANLQDVFRDSLNDALRDPFVPPVRFAAGQDEASMLQQGLQLLDVFHANLPTETVVAVEQSFEVPVWLDDAAGTQHVITGYLDLVLVDDAGKVVVLDWKCVGKKPSQFSVDTSLQRLVYLEALRSIYPDADVSFRIAAAVKTKTPTFVSIDAGHRPDDEQRLVELVKRAARIVEAGAFLPVDPFSMWRCGGCPVAHGCSLRS